VTLTGGGASRLWTNERQANPGDLVVFTITIDFRSR
jgi:hypothetical protein